jgi:hypothetical protein
LLGRAEKRAGQVRNPETGVMEPISVANERMRSQQLQQRQAAGAAPAAPARNPADNFRPTAEAQAQAQNMRYQISPEGQRAHASSAVRPQIEAQQKRERDAQQRRTMLAFEQRGLLRPGEDRRPGFARATQDMTPGQSALEAEIAKQAPGWQAEASVAPVAAAQTSPVGDLRGLSGDAGPTGNAGSSSTPTSAPVGSSTPGRIELPEPPGEYLGTTPGESAPAAAAQTPLQTGSDGGAPATPEALGNSLGLSATEQPQTPSTPATDPNQNRLQTGDRFRIPALGVNLPAPVFDPSLPQSPPTGGGPTPTPGLGLPPGGPSDEWLAKAMGSYDPNSRLDQRKAEAARQAWARNNGNLTPNQLYADPGYIQASRRA